MDEVLFCPKNEECPGTLRYPGYYEKIYSFVYLCSVDSFDYFSITSVYEQNMNKK